MGIEVRDICALLSVYDMPEAVRFYGLLGFEVVSRSPTYEVIDSVEHFHWCMLKNSETALMLNTEYNPGERPAERPATKDQPFGAWFYLSCPDVDGAYAQLKVAGVKCEPPKVVKYGGEYGFRVVSVRDPDGHGITLQWPAEK